MKKYRVMVASTIYYEAEIEAESREDIQSKFDEGNLDFTTWKEIDLESNIDTIRELKL